MNEHIILTNSERIQHRLLAEGIGSVLLDFENEIAVQSLAKEINAPVIIIIGVFKDVVTRFGKAFVAPDVRVRCYASDITDCDVAEKDITSLIDAAVVGKIDLITKRFLLRPYELVQEEGTGLDNVW